MANKSREQQQASVQRIIEKITKALVQNIHGKYKSSENLYYSEVGPSNAEHTFINIMPCEPLSIDRQQANSVAKYIEAVSPDNISQLLGYIAELAAENVGLKQFIQTECFVGQSEPETFYEEEVTRYVSADGYEPEVRATDSVVAGIKADVWAEAKDFTKSMLACDSVDHLDFLFDGKIQQLREGTK